RALPSDPTASYRERVGRAAGALEELAVSCERAAGGGAKSEGRPRGESAESAAEQLPARQQVALKSARRLLPARERVESAGGAVEVDNSWLHEALDECEKVADYGKRAASLRAVSQRLRALESRLAELEGAPAAGRDKDAERGRLNAILRDPAFDQAPQGNALRGLADDFRDWVVRHWPRFGGGGSPSPRLSMLAQAVVLGLCVVVLAYVARRVWAGRARELKSLRLKRRPRVILGERVEPDATPADLLASAEGLARAGDLRGAIRKAYVALLCGLGDGGVIRLAQHKTNRDYLDAVRRSAPERLYAEMLPLTRGFEQHWYGLRDASAAEWDDYNARCRRTLRESGG
ncbi:MAG TPA: DUF4129 domain-containing protein, partial [Pyrinomonadaceae bacterium]|nr:DUF4129 domain-containing protein [Pyrinomonadaceae bacterium]